MLPRAAPLLYRRGVFSATHTMLVTADHEIELGHLLRGGDLVARNELVESTRPLAIYLANSYWHRCSHCSKDDLFQAAFLGLICGADRFDPDSYPGRRFATIARYYIRMEILNYLYGRSMIWIPRSARPSEMATHPLSSSGCQQNRDWNTHCVTKAGKVAQGQDQELDYSDSSQSQSNSDVEESHAADLEQLRVGLEMLPLWHAEVLSRRFGLGGRPQETIQAIAGKAGLSRATVYNVQNLALRRLRETMHDQFSDGT